MSGGRRLCDTGAEVLRPPYVPPSPPSPMGLQPLPLTYQPALGDAAAAQRLGHSLQRQRLHLNLLSMTDLMSWSVLHSRTGLIILISITLEN